MTDKAKVWAMMAIGAIVGGISGAETAGKLPGKLKNAMELAKTVQGLLASLPLRETSTQYSNANANAPYEDNDPRAPGLSRASFRATVTCPGRRIEF